MLKKSILAVALVIAANGANAEVEVGGKVTLAQLQSTYDGITCELDRAKQMAHCTTDLVMLGEAARVSVDVSTETEELLGVKFQFLASSYPLFDKLTVARYGKDPAIIANGKARLWSGENILAVLERETEVKGVAALTVISLNHPDAK